MSRVSDRTLVLLAHPDLASSRVHARLATAARDVDGVTVHDLAAAAPDGRFDVRREQQLLVEHERIVLQFPWYWYSVPAVLKGWMDQVLLYGFAYGADGTALRGKSVRVVTSTGGPAESYQRGGYNRFTMDELLRPLDATAHLCGLRMADPVVLQGARLMPDDELDAWAAQYADLLARRAADAAA